MQQAVREEPRWHAGMAALAAVVLYVTLPQKIIVGPLWLMPVLVGIVLVPLMVLKPRRHQETRTQRLASIYTVAVLNAFNIATIVTLFFQLLSEHHHKNITGEELLRAAVEIWLTNIIVYALWYWEIDGNGPDARAHCQPEQVPRRFGFLFPQMAMQSEAWQKLNWKPRFVDYLFLSFNTATAFSPTDTFPLTPMSKVLMMGESITSLVTIAVIAGRAINILGTG